MRALITIDMAGAAFEACGVPEEIEHVLMKCRERLACQGDLAVGDVWKLYDSNGNTCGQFEIVE